LSEKFLILHSLRKKIRIFIGFLICYKIMAEKKTTKKATATKAEAPKKAAAKKTVAKAVFTVNAENAGFKAGDVYQALAAAGKALNVKEIAKAAKISEEETLLGLGWLFKEGKLATADEKITLA
jgi:hypothetical protein